MAVKKRYQQHDWLNSSQLVVQHEDVVELQSSSRSYESLELEETSTEHVHPN